ncbi:NAD(P)-binding protein [Metschnikowia bicuspidata var. bicuspidata NRRL YB-4993]|uniref:NAD(P)-binding protein n=1 Tax=Metschnikowia bicuspidata var. bicuspidata NRRL YB-4993 TaxID=869754 RepID=A0A1A0H7S0_9ASCO|nr:NAD(P)-binding protein [Metschnikowia bicuspidata var. bicuspidata NRRL YB-4993]OBA20071.1 NAD(P)-binding protein [Metschnikowia bicuspidata var. bicuspidata NRRL YB-4993]
MSIPTTQNVALARKQSDSPDGIEYAEVDTPQITDPHDMIIKNKYAGVNFIDAYFRKGIYPTEFPHIFGKEASGVIVAVGEAVTSYKVGDKVAYMAAKSFAQYTKVSDDAVQIKKLPDDSTDEDLKKWAAVLLQGLTAITLSIESYKVEKGDFILVWAAAGGVGQILTKLTSSLGARVIAIASTDDKLRTAKAKGAEFLIKVDENIPARVAEITNGQGVRASFDSVGKDSFEDSFASVGRKGTLVSYGNASGVVPPFSINRLSSKNMKITRSVLFNSVQTKEEWVYYTDILEDALRRDTVDVTIYKTYPLSEYSQAMKDLEGRKTSGKLVLEIS